jgi:hypothetical protein
MIVTHTPAIAQTIADRIQCINTSGIDSYQDLFRKIKLLGAQTGLPAISIELRDRSGRWAGSPIGLLVQTGSPAQYEFTPVEFIFNSTIADYIINNNIMQIENGNGVISHVLEILQI